jgi:hypothetical protein
MKERCSEKELRQKRKMKLLGDLNKAQRRMYEISLCLQRPKVFPAKRYNELADEHHALTIRAGNIERCLYREFYLTNGEIENEIMKL